MRRFTAFATATGIALGVLLLVAAFITTPSGTAYGAGLLVTPSVTVDPGRGTPDDPGPVPSRTPTRAATPAASPTTAPTATPTPRRGTLVVAPTTAAAGAEVTVTGTGFSANAPLALAIEADTDGTTAAYVQPSVDGSGNFSQRFATAGFRPGVYTVSVHALPNTQALAQAKLTISGTPGLPNTGTGIADDRGRTGQLALAGILAATMLGLAGVALRRRRA